MHSENQPQPFIFEHLTPGEFAAVAALLAGSELASTESPRSSDVTDYLDWLTQTDPEKAVTAHRTLADSPLSPARAAASRTLPELSRAHYEGGYELWQRLIGDPDKSIRDDVEKLLAECSGGRNLWPNTGFYKVEHINEATLVEDIGLTRQDVYDLYLTYAYAENGACFDLGRAALAKVDWPGKAIEQ